jgi:hypothetical protein
MIIEPKNYETPETGVFLGTIIDVIDVGKKMTPWGEKHKIQIVWVLNALDSQGKPFRILREPPISMNEKSKLYETVRDVFAPQVLPPGAFETEWLVGRSNRLYVRKELPNAKGRVYANIIDISPLQAGDVAPVTPADYVRAHLRPANTANFGQQARSVQQVQQPAVPFGQAAPAVPVQTQAVSTATVPPVAVVQPSVFVPNAAPLPVQAQAPQQPAPVKF